MHGVLVVFTFRREWVRVLVFVLLVGLVDALNVAALKRAEGPTMQTLASIRTGAAPSPESSKGFLGIAALELALHAFFEG